MRQILLFSIMLFFSIANTFSQDEYKSLLTEGRIWEVVTTSPINYGNEVFYIKLDGDTIVDGHVCEILFHTNNESSWEPVLLEENKIIYKYDDTTKEFLPLMDFNLHAGDRAGDWGSVLFEDEVEVDGSIRRRLAIGNEGESPLAYWVEGIGGSKDYWVTPFDKHIGAYSYMTECHENGERVFTQEDFCKVGSPAYLPVLTEGRMWKLSYTYRGSRQDIPDAYMTITVDGDSIVDGKICKKLLVDYRTLVSAVYPKYIVAYEKGGKAYMIDEDGEEHLIMDMSLHEGDAVDEVQTVLEEDYIEIDGIRRKRLMIDSGIDHIDGEYLYYMVEGVGLSKDEFVFTGLIDENIYFHRLLACYDDGKCIFSTADFDKEGTSGMTYPPVISPTDNSIYDLQGRKRSCIMKGEIFIRNGKKYIKR